MSRRPRVAFVCVHNSCRSQIAEALGKLLAADAFESCSGGTETVPRINQDAVRLMRELYGVDMELTQRSKLITELPPGHRGDHGLQRELSAPALPSPRGLGPGGPDGQGRRGLPRDNSGHTSACALTERAAAQRGTGYATRVNTGRSEDMPSCGLPDAVELCITKFVNIPPAEYIGDMALC